MLEINKLFMSPDGDAGDVSPSPAVTTTTATTTTTTVGSGKISFDELSVELLTTILEGSREETEVNDTFKIKDTKGELSALNLGTEFSMVDLIKKIAEITTTVTKVDTYVSDDKRTEESRELLLLRREVAQLNKDIERLKKHGVNPSGDDDDSQNYSMDRNAYTVNNNPDTVGIAVGEKEITIPKTPFVTENRAAQSRTKITEANAYIDENVKLANQLNSAVAKIMNTIGRSA